MGDVGDGVRDAVTLVVDYDGAEDFLDDYAENLSSGTTVVATDRELPIGTAVRLVLQFAGLLKPIALDGVVRSTNRDGDGASACIEIAAGRDRDELAAITQRIRARDQKTMARSFRVLIVEDNRPVASLIEDGLIGSSRREYGRGLHFVVSNAEDGRAAIECLRRETFDVVIIDMYLPIVDGSRVIQVARTELGLDRLPIIAVSAGGEGAQRLAFDAGASSFLDKPMRLRQVIDTIQKLTSG